MGAGLGVVVLSWGVGRRVVILDSRLAGGPAGWLGDWQVPWPSAMTPGPQAVDLPRRTWRTLLNLWRWGRTLLNRWSWGQGNGRSLP